MEPSEQDKMRVAAATLENLNEIIKRGDVEAIQGAINGCPYPRQLAYCYDRDGQGIFFKLIRIPHEA